MNKKIASILLALFLCLCPDVIAQEKPDPGQGPEKTKALEAIPDSLEGMLARALQTSPDIQVAEADLLHAQASVRQVRLKVSQAVVEIYHDFKLQQIKREHVEQQLTRLRSMIAAGVSGGESEIPLVQALSEAGAGMARSEAMIRTLLGVESTATKLPEALEDLLAGSFENNAEIALAESMLARMQAVLNQTRFKVTQEVANAFQARRVKRNALDMAGKMLQVMQQRYEQGSIPQENVMAPLQAMIESEAELMQVEARIRYLLGLGLKVQAKRR